MNRRSVLILGSLASGAALWLAAQQLQQPAGSQKTLPELMPGGALLAVEARDLNSLVSAWNASPEKKTWLASGSYQTYVRSKLALRLEEVQKEYAAGLGVNPNYALLENIAGGDSAVAVYDIGKLEMLYLTRLPQARAADNLLTRARTKFQSRTASGQQYFTKTAGDGTVAFAIAGDLLIVATREDLVAGSLSLLRNAAGSSSLRQERWYTQGATAAGATNPPDVRLSVNMDRTARTPHFRSYWIQQNITALKSYTATVSDLYFGQASWTEKRTLVRAEPQQAPTSSELADLASYLPAGAGLVQAWARPSDEEVQTLIRERFVPSAPSASAPEMSAPPETAESHAGGEDDLDQRIDAPEVTLLQNGARALPIAGIANGSHVVAAARIAGSRSLNDGVYHNIDSAIVLLRDANWDSKAVQTALRESGMEANGLAPLHSIVDGKVWILSNAKPLADRIVAAHRAGNANAVGTAAGVTYSAVYRHSVENANYARMMRMLDFPKLPTTTPRPPMLFSENIAGIGDVLGRIESVTMESKDEGAVVRQSVVYQRKRGS